MFISISRSLFIYRDLSIYLSIYPFICIYIYTLYVHIYIYICISTCVHMAYFVCLKYFSSNLTSTLSLNFPARLTMAKLLMTFCFLASVLPAHADVEAFKTCFMQKVLVIKEDCHGACTPVCKAALDRMLVTVDGSCCDNLEEGDGMTPADCKVMVKTQFTAKIQAMEAQECGPGGDNFAFVFEQLAEQGIFKVPKETPAAAVGLLGMMATAFVSASVGAAVTVAFTQRRSIASPVLLG